MLNQQVASHAGANQQPTTSVGNTVGSSCQQSSANDTIPVNNSATDFFTRKPIVGGQVQQATPYAVNFQNLQATNNAGAGQQTPTSVENADSSHYQQSSDDAVVQSILNSLLSNVPGLYPGNPTVSRQVKQVTPIYTVNLGNKQATNYAGASQQPTTSVGNTVSSSYQQSTGNAKATSLLQSIVSDVASFPGNHTVSGPVGYVSPIYTVNLQKQKASNYAGASQQPTTPVGTTSHQQTSANSTSSVNNDVTGFHIRYPSVGGQVQQGGAAGKTPGNGLEILENGSINTTASPSVNTTASSSVNATASPSVNATASPSVNATASSSVNATAYPSVNATAYPSVNATAYPSVNATAYPFPNTPALHFAFPSLNVSYPSSYTAAPFHSSPVVEWRNLYGFQKGLPAKGVQRQDNQLEIVKADREFLRGQQDVKRDGNGGLHTVNLEVDICKSCGRPYFGGLSRAVELDVDDVKITSPKESSLPKANKQQNTINGIRWVLICIMILLFLYIGVYCFFNVTTFLSERGN